MPRRRRRVRHATQTAQPPHVRSTSIANVAIDDVSNFHSAEPIKLAISQLPGAWVAFRLRRRKNEPPGE